WVEPENIHAFDGPQKENFIKTGKGRGFKEAIEECENYKTNPTILEGVLEPAEELDTNAEFDRIRNGPNPSTSENIPTSSSGMELDESTGNATAGASSSASASKRKRSSMASSNNEKATPPQRGRKNSQKSSTARKTKGAKSDQTADSTTPSAKATPKRLKRDQSLDDLASNDSTNDFDQTPHNQSIRSRASQQHHRQTNHNDLQSQQPYVSGAGGAAGGRSFLNRSVVMREEEPVIDMKPNSSIINRKIEPTSKRIGFLGLGIMGSTIAKNFLQSGHKVSVWNKHARNVYRLNYMELPFEKHLQMFARNVTSFSHLVFGNCGILDRDILTDKAYVEMSTIDPETSNAIANGIHVKGGRYLEAQIQGSKLEAEAGTLVVIAGGDRSVYDDCQSCFQSISKNTFFLGEAGNATKVNLIIQTLAGTCLAGLSECLALADRFSILPSDIMDIIGLTSMNSHFLLSKAETP
uniref:6-phosphogluconate dehydrogenase NADP-binding domain-containing protein n=1 Tax=Megaselia scalaris TaxID=36166 RepID=T1GPL2_MEGSC